MKQGGGVSGFPVGLRKGVRVFLGAGTLVLGLNIGFAPAFADSILSGVGNVRNLLKYSQLEVAPIYRGKTLEDRLDMDRAETERAPLEQPMIAETRLPVRPPVKPRVEAASLRLPHPLTFTPTSRQKPTVLLGSVGRPVTLTPVSKRWERALAGFETPSAGLVHVAAQEEGPASDRLADKAYAAILQKLAKDRRARQIPQVNFMVNRLLSYRQDAQLWKTGEYWASPMESLARRAGDCEDYAILKYALLRDLGVKDEEMRVVVLMDKAARQHHAVLAVRHDGKWLILDNRFSRVRFERDLPNYQVFYTVNATGQWAHAAGGKSLRLASRLKSFAN